MFHNSVISLRKALGFYGTEQGCCRGITLRWIEACILNEEPIFDARIRKIDRDGKLLVKSIEDVKQKVRDRKELTQEDMYLLDILAFYESLELYHSPQKFPAIFNNRYLNQHNIDSISTLAASDKIGKLGNLTTIYSEPGIYTVDEISVYLDELANAIHASDCTPENIQGFVLSSMRHAIGLTYQPQVGWKFMDINQYPSLSFKQTRDIAKIIAIGFQNLSNISSYFAFNTSVIVTGNHAKHDRLTEQLEIVKKSHVITGAIAQREAIINLAWIAAKHGHANHICLLAEAGADLGKADNDGVTPALMAALNGHADVIAALANAHADLNKSNKDGVTPAFTAAQYDHADVIAALADANADLDKAMNNGATPAFIAAQKGHIHVINTLLTYKANMDIPFISSAKNLCDFASNRGESVISKMNTFIQKHLAVGGKAESISIKPCDIAWIMGHDAIVNLLREKQEVSSTGMFAYDAEKSATMVTENKKNTGFTPK